MAVEARCAALRGAVNVLCFVSLLSAQSAQAGTLSRLIERARNAVPLPNGDLSRVFRGQSDDGVTLHNTKEVNSQGGGEFPVRLNSPTFSKTIEAELVDRFPIAGIYPITASSPSLVYGWDTKLEIEIPEETALAPIFSERYQTAGNHRLTLGAVVTYYDYDRLDGVSFDNLNNEVRGGGDLGDKLSERFNVQLNYWILTLTGTFGLTRTWDVSILVPLVRVDAEVTREADIIRPSAIGTVHSFDPNRVVSRISGATASATEYGIGDLVLRTKKELFESADWGLAGGLGVTIPTGDAERLMGGDSVVLDTGLYASGQATPRIFPHANVGLDFKLADTGVVDDLFHDSKSQDHSIDSPAVLGFRWTAGVSVKLHPLVTAVFDVRGLSDIAEREQLHLPAGGEGLVKERVRDNLFDVALGLRGWLIKDRAIGFVNFLVPLNRDRGARSNFAPTFGVEIPI